MRYRRDSIGPSYDAADRESGFPTPTASVTVGRHATNQDRGLRVTVDLAVSVWRQLPAETGAVMYDEERLRTLIAGDLRLAAALDVLTSEMVAIGIGLSRAESLAESAGPNSWTYPFMGRGQGPVQLEPDSVVPVEALLRGAPELAEELVTRLRLRLRSRH